MDATGGRETGLNDPGVEVNEDGDPEGVDDTRGYCIDGIEIFACTYKLIQTKGEKKQNTHSRMNFGKTVVMKEFHSDETPLFDRCQGNDDHS
jgi:hypothetical protein